MELIQLSGCASTACPKVFMNVDGSVVVQGATVDGVIAGLAVPSHEGVVQIPRHIFDDAVKALSKA